MELQEIVSVALGTLIVIVIAHFAVFWVVRTLYPPFPQAPQVFTPAPLVEQQTPIQHVTVPTYATPMPMEAPREEGERKGPPPPEDTSIRRDSGLVASNTQ